MNNYIIYETKILNPKHCKYSNTMNINEINSTSDYHISIKKIKNTFQMRPTLILSLRRFLKMKLKKKFYI